MICDINGFSVFMTLRNKYFKIYLLYSVSYINKLTEIENENQLEII